MVAYQFIDTLKYIYDNVIHFFVIQIQFKILNLSMKKIIIDKPFNIPI